MKRIVSGDQVKVISGNEAGKVGVVRKVLYSSVGRRKEVYVIVSDVNVRRFVKKTQAGKKFDAKSYPIAVSNVALLAGDGFVSKVGFKLKDGTKKRIFKRTAEFV
ncbi:50S ribosomal protein L24 [Neorickettsia sennetsu]|uniref:Large ribosomal subunit protein uL24 n=1 Tax=Ehrlichia sennetsu (strain ATCC VR-367 / Miyayama) TaxID=222891 RepID=RL24_EHRS3|nr:50S ribosomal protein L24 [Neorickettsia sennetsu]Q2GEC8.1 RecName: Full=Large ribosomal subunit protein uL24; AltName: Full=50S ribosomal protein L24 [Neorickettsia sennetsu str. Miyayama]ABD46467.1 ribosomal protein L24 [Neorickettsia sennetsu str. Miyayama]